jgi:DNA helicase MCM9
MMCSVCPQLYGLFTVKLALLLMLIGGLERVDENGTRIRGQVHMLLVGDPGTGEAQQCH